jgi:nucleoside-diphosphate-sugar epimerase
MNRVLITGGSGYFGSVLVRRLLEQGVNVAVFDIEDAHDRPEDVAFIRGDIRDPHAIRTACHGMDHVYHCVAMVPLAKSARKFWSVNQEGTRNILQACLESEVRKVVHISSSAVFGIPEKNPVDDTVKPRPQEDYGKAKLAAEDLCHEYAGKGLDVTIVRPRTIMGHGRLGIMQIIFEWIRQCRNVPVLGKGDNLYQFVHADDLASACIKAAKRKGPAVYNIGAQDFCTMRETLEGLIAHAGTKSRVVSLPMGPATAMMRLTSRLGLSPLGPYHALMYGRTMYFDLTHAKEELDWSPEYGNVEMFCESYDWYLENREDALKIQGASHHRSAVKQGVLEFVSWFLSLARPYPHQPEG